MATSLRMYVFATFLVSCGAFALLVVALVTPHWVDSEGKPTSQRPENHHINYGLWNGAERDPYLTSNSKYDLSIVCIMDEGKCMFSMKTTPEAREAEARTIISGQNSSCSSVSSIVTTTTVAPTTISVASTRFETRATTDMKDSLLDAGIWVSTIFFLAFGIIMALVSGFFSVLNTATNPVEQILSIFGMYIWNGIGAGSCLLVLLIWGANFAIHLSINISTCNTITKRLNTEGLAALGYSYWMVFVAMVLYLSNMGLLYLRQFLLDRQPPPPTITIDENPDGTIFLY